jgi:phage virion morphogenesis protein
MEITLDLRDVRADLGRLAARLEDPAPVMAEIAQHLELSTQRRFELEEGPDGTAWLKSRRAKAEGGKTLQKTRALLRSIRSASSAEESVVGVAKSGGPGIYAAMHQFGATIVAKTAKGLSFSVRGEGGKPKRVVVKSVRIPARPFLGLSDGDRSAVRGIVGDYLAGAVGGQRP